METFYKQTQSHNFLEWQATSEMGLPPSTPVILKVKKLRPRKVKKSSQVQSLIDCMVKPGLKGAWTHMNHPSPSTSFLFLSSEWGFLPDSWPCHHLRESWDHL